MTSPPAGKDESADRSSDQSSRPASADADEARAFARSFRSFLDWVHSEDTESRTNEVARLAGGFLGPDGATTSVVTRELPPFEHVNLQAALDEWSVQTGRTVDVHGISLPPHYGRLSLQQIVAGEGLPPLRLSAPGLIDLPNGPGTTLACLRLALLLVTDARGRFLVMINGPSEHEPALSVEIAGLPVDAAQALHSEFDELRSRLNVYRGQIVDVTAGIGLSLTFADLPSTTRDDVVLPSAVLDRVERHAVGVATHRQALLDAGQHLKRGLLLYGPPGTGKTHTTRYIVRRMEGYTRLLLTGRSLGAVGEVTSLARALQPAVVVLEDVDLVAEDRSFGPGSSPVLFDLLDAMDGAAADADLLFLLTTNRADLLEPALAARPGRVDVAVEIGLPDADARRALLLLYGRTVPLALGEDDVAAAVARTEGVTASFLKELIRRAVLESLEEQSPLTTVTGTHIARALDDLLDSTQQVTRTLLGVPGESDGEVASAGLGPGPVVYSGSYQPMRGRRAYSSSLTIHTD